MIRDETDNWRVVEAATGRGLRWRDLAGRLAQANAIFVGEQHDDPETHKLEARLFAEVHKKVGPKLALAMEMIERDGQAGLDDYLTGKIDEAAFAKAVTLWKTYPTDYRAMVEYAKTNKLAVFGSNAPAKFVRLVGQKGLAGLESLAPAEKTLIAAAITAPMGDTYQRKFFATMTGMGVSHGPAMDASRLRGIYEAQCLRDDTMAETIVRALDKGHVVYHVNGSFHSDGGMGTAARTLFKRPLGTKLALVKAIPVPDVRTADPSEFKAEADWLVFVPAPRK
ncbi:ChaN family lipoprotein [Armatimonas sp.]|uniref:ChaN family lipoprotein n=1 Tax=Armatimonas sp. TaxID=1872638 RepID=UPI0037505329